MQAKPWWFRWVRWPLRRYYIATYSDRIFAEPTTITGSIGVFGSSSTSSSWPTIWLHVDSVKTGQVADIFSISRPKTEAELAIFQELVDWFYDEFTVESPSRAS